MVVEVLEVTVVPHLQAWLLCYQTIPPKLHGQSCHHPQTQCQGQPLRFPELLRLQSQHLPVVAGHRPDFHLIYRRGHQNPKAPVLTAGWVSLQCLQQSSSSAFSGHLLENLVLSTLRLSHSSIHLVCPTFLAAHSCSTATEALGYLLFGSAKVPSVAAPVGFQEVTGSLFPQENLIW